MMTLATLISPNEALATLERQLDLSAIRGKLADPEEGKGYGPEHLDLLEREYRRFLALRLAHPDANIVPCKLVDEMWHQHILDTIAYRRDCDVIFGRFMDHFPYFGMRGPEDEQALHDAYEETLEHYHAAFGEPVQNTWISADASKCRTGCKPVKCR
ncbi:MAG TPA: hypothetical protein VMG80_02020 [Solirubrobacteraceae bacterium]|nr:hypothetical protein [Solirubrobacteraceae bacterium]